jgi:hypothetical protein
VIADADRVSQRFELERVLGNAIARGKLKATNARAR